MQSKTRGQLATKLKVWAEAPTNVVLQDLLNGIPSEWQLHQLRQHLETGQSFLNRTVCANQTQAVHNIALWAVAADGRKDFSILNGFKWRQSFLWIDLSQGRQAGIVLGRQRHQTQRKPFTAGQLR